jgi:rubrerythrin
MRVQGYRRQWKRKSYVARPSVTTANGSHFLVIDIWLKRLHSSTMKQTSENLKEAFAGESQASQKYLAFARKAEKEGFKNIATLFRTAAEAERIHAEGHFGAMDGIGSTAQNLTAAIEGETYEFTQMYPPMLQQAQAEGHKAKRMFDYAVKAEAVHAELYKMALEAVKKGQDLPEPKIYLCPVCGHIEFGTPPESCPICRTKGSSYVQVGQ